MNKDAESWARVKPEAVLAGSHAQAVNVLTMALEDIATLAHSNQMLRNQLKAVTAPKPRRAPRMRFGANSTHEP